MLIKKIWILKKNLRFFPIPLSMMLHAHQAAPAEATVEQVSATPSAPVSATALPPMEDVFPSSRYFLPMSVFLTAATV